ncbi:MULTISPECIES: 3-oxoacyl-[acyl-carrier-protein] synthase III C-terminal domain-containing protein [Caproicibacterium]|uniref:3-oxoacyl-[acyl-carrier-protein] synthase III C-terminal domain-containing protein n=1 Tax=Caproicibacterium argilliputei TaxID=3030016 RepID=A0AA97DC77_9FIRM|nr:3-oxoacyl-[acyl-carrier-protein] synthase III C-terminal domain-containing protein [Caproicibacterium argilliputei]WOC33149.1 3-oxoacyl-[acyl-carrier-protein] synthase III C-terminal domain-containing protein [Caproicibacterium argilliputei]
MEDNEKYIAHFKERGKDVEHFFRDVYGRDKRYRIDLTKESSLTLATAAAKKVLKNTGITGSALDMILFSSQLPEYVAPPSSVLVHYAVGGKTDCICYDINVDCTGLSTALESAAKYMSVSENVNKVMLVGCDLISMIADPECEYSYGIYGDAACALILEKTEEDCGLQDSKLWVNSDEHADIVFPGCGFSKLFQVEDRSELLLRWNPDATVNLEDASEHILQLLQKNHLSVDDVKMFCCSQSVYLFLQKLRALLSMEESQSLYVGDEYGYTGTTSPFIVLWKSIQQGMVKKGDYVVIWTIGSGRTNIVLLLKL